MNTLTLLRKKLGVMQELNDETSIRRKRKNVYRIPSLDLLRHYDSELEPSTLSTDEIENKISDLGFETAVEEIKHGPVVTRYALKLARGVRLSQIRKVEEDIGLVLKSNNIRIQAPIPGTSLIGIEMPNKKKSIISFKDILSAETDAKIPVALGTDTIGTPKIIDLAEMPHLLIAGQTGSGKSVCLNSIVLSILYTRTPEECQLVLVDPKRVELASYNNIPHLRCPVVTEVEDTIEVFSSLINEMERRYKLLEQYRVRNIEGFNNKSENKLPYIVTIVDEMADLMMTSGKELEGMIIRLAQLARAVGIHLVLATQKPIVKVITSLIKANMPSRISFKVSTKIDSRVILDSNGAETLSGKGDMLMVGPGLPEPERFHGAWISDEEIINITDSIRG